MDDTAQPPDPEDSPAPRAPRTSGDSTGLGPVQVALALLVLLLGLLVVGALWPVITGA